MLRKHFVLVLAVALVGLGLLIARFSIPLSAGLLNARIQFGLPWDDSDVAKITTIRMVGGATALAGLVLGIIGFLRARAAGNLPAILSGLIAESYAAMVGGTTIELEIRPVLLGVSEFSLIINNERVDQIRGDNIFGTFTLRGKIPGPGSSSRNVIVRYAKAFRFAV